MITGNTKIKNWKIFIPFILILTGTSILVLITFEPYKIYGLIPSPLIKLLVAITAFIFIFIGIFLKSWRGAKAMAVLSGLSGDEINQFQSQPFYRFIENLTLLMGFILVFCIFVDEKSAVFNLDISRFYNDTFSYVNTSSNPMASIHFWAGGRPFTVPLFYKGIGYTLSNYGKQGMMNDVAYYQTLFSILSWTIFAASFTLAIRDKFVKVIGFATILIFGASIDIAAWDKAMLSESISTSLLVVFLGTLIIAGIMWDKKHAIPAWKQVLLVIGIILAGILYSFSRDTNSYFILFIGGLMIVGIILPAIREHPLFPAYLAVLASFLTIFGVQSISATIGKRFESPLLHIIHNRIMPSKGYLDFFIQHGMPFNEELASMSKEDFNSIGSHNFIETTPSEQAIAAFLHWIDTSGKTVMMEFYLSHPSYFFAAPLNDFWHIVNGENSEYRKIAAAPSARVTLSTSFFYPRINWFPYLTSVLLIITLLVVWRRINGSAIWYLTLILFLSIYPLALLVWHSDTAEIERHAFQITFQIRLTSWIVIVLLIDRSLNYLKIRKII